MLNYLGGSWCQFLLSTHTYLQDWKYPQLRGGEKGSCRMHGAKLGRGARPKSQAKESEKAGEVEEQGKRAKVGEKQLKL